MEQGPGQNGILERGGNVSTRYVWEKYGIDSEPLYEDYIVSKVQIRPDATGHVYLSTYSLIGTSVDVLRLKVLASIPLAPGDESKIKSGTYFSISQNQRTVGDTIGITAIHYSGEVDTTVSVSDRSTYFYCSFSPNVIYVRVQMSQGSFISNASSDDSNKYPENGIGGG